MLHCDNPKAPRSAQEQPLSGRNPEMPLRHKIPPNATGSAFRLSQSDHPLGSACCPCEQADRLDASRLLGATALSGLAAPSPPSRVASRPPVSIAGANTLRLF